MGPADGVAIERQDCPSLRNQCYKMNIAQKLSREIGSKIIQKPPNPKV
jgi:hypothetical protein